MSRAFLCLLLWTTTAAAEEYRGTFQKLDADKRTLQILISSNTYTLPLATEVKVFGLARMPLKDGFDSKLLSRPGVFVQVKTVKQDGREVIVEIELQRRGK